MSIKLDPGMFHKSLDGMLEQLKHLSDNDIGKSVFDDEDGDEIDGLAGKPIGAVEITKVSGGPVGSELHEDFDHDGADPRMSEGADNTLGGDDDNDDLMSALGDIEHMTGEKADPEFLRAGGRDPRDFIKQYAGSGDRSNVGIHDPRMEDDSDDDAAFPEERLARLLGNKKF